MNATDFTQADFVGRLIGTDIKRNKIGETMRKDVPSIWAHEAWQLRGWL